MLGVHLVHAWPCNPRLRGLKQFSLPAGPRQLPAQGRGPLVRQACMCGPAPRRPPKRCLPPHLPSLPARERPSPGTVGESSQAVARMHLCVHPACTGDANCSTASCSTCLSASVGTSCSPGWALEQGNAPADCPKHTRAGSSGQLHGLASPTCPMSTSTSPRCAPQKALLQLQALRMSLAAGLPRAATRPAAAKQPCCPRRTTMRAPATRLCGVGIRACRTGRAWPPPVTQRACRWPAAAWTYEQRGRVGA